MSQTPVYDIKDLSGDEQDRLLDAAADACDWMLQVHSPAKGVNHVLCLWFKDGTPSEFRDLMRELCIEPQDAARLAKLYEADYALHQSPIEIMGAYARAFRVNATQDLTL